MATTVTDSRSTLYDHVTLEAPDGGLMPIVDVLKQVLPVVQDAPAYPTNGTFGHRTAIRTSNPTISFGKINKGIKRSKGTWENRNDTFGMFVARHEKDIKIRKVVGDASFQHERWIQDQGFIEGLAQAFSQNLIYGDTKVDEASFDGVAGRLGSLQTASKQKSQVWGAGASGGDNTSIYIVDWGERGAHLIYPKDGGIAGLDKKDWGDVPNCLDVNGDPMTAAVMEYSWYVGLAVEDPRHIARLANISVADANLVEILKATPSYPTNGSIINKLEDLLGEMPSQAGMNRVMYAHSRIVTAFRKQARSFSNQALQLSDYLDPSTGNVLDKDAPYLHGIPLRRLDQISITESTVA
jgi:hypothetical protein